MSRWLKSVNNLLETLDGTAENVVNDPTDIPTSRGAIGQILSRRGMDYDNEEDYDEDEDADDEYYDEDEESPGEEEEVLDFTDNTTPNLEYSDFSMTPHDQKLEAMPPTDAIPDVEPPKEQSDQSEMDEPKPLPADQPVAPPSLASSGVLVSGEELSDNTSDGAVLVKDHSEVDSITTEEPPSPPPPKPMQEPAPKRLFAASPPPSAQSSAPTSLRSPPVSGTSSHMDSTINFQQQLKKIKLELKKSQTETRQLRKHVMQLNQELETSEAEVKAQQAELVRAAERMEKDRQRANEEREDLLDEQEEELENQKTQYEKQLQDQKDRYEDQIAELQERVEVVEEQRTQEGGDWTKEVEESLQREREALKRLDTMREENATLKSSMAKLETQHRALQNRIDSMAQSNQTASKREREAEDKLDAALSLHSRQLSQRQSREAELERTIADLGAALARARQKEKSVPTSSSDTINASLREKFEMAVDELETLRAQLTLETERCDALRNELRDISKERTAEATESQARQRQYDREVSDLKATVSRLQVTMRERKPVQAPVSGEADVSELYRKLDDASKQIASLSDQLIRQQTVDQKSKQEIFALTNRLQSATSRAESAENALATASSNRDTYDLDGGVAYSGATMRRRVKGGRSRGASNVRSIRSSLGMNPGRVGDGMEQFAITVDAIDSFLVDTGSFLKHEPLARLGFVLYLCILHLWSFCLVVFHASTYEDVHGDFGSMSDPGGHGPQALLRNGIP